MNVTTQGFRPRLGVQAEGVQAEGVQAEGIQAEGLSPKFRTLQPSA
jgi:hypothetical protein